MPAIASSCLWHRFSGVVDRPKFLFVRRGGRLSLDAVSVSQLVSPVWCAQQLAVLARKPVTRFAGDVPCTLATLPPEQCELACSPSKTEATQAQLQAVRKSEETPDSKCPAR